jgi:hypothetical protein
MFAMNGGSGTPRLNPRERRQPSGHRLRRGFVCTNGSQDRVAHGVQFLASGRQSSADPRVAELVVGSLAASLIPW